MAKGALCGEKNGRSAPFFLDASHPAPYHLQRPVSAADQAVYFNGVPLLVLAGVYLLVATALAPTLWRERSRVSHSDLALALIFPAIAIAAAIFGALVVYDRTPIGGHVWPPFAATVIAIVPALIFLGRWSAPAGVLMSGARAREAEQLVTARDRELDSVAMLANALSRAQEPVEAGRVLLDEVVSLLQVEFTALALVTDEEDEATGLVARSGDADLDWWTEVRVHLHNEPSGIASAYFEAAPVSVYDVESSPLVSPRLVKAVGAKSGAFVPLVVEERVIGVLIAATTGERRAFTSEELRLMQALAGEAAIALDRTRSASALDQALARERLVGKISRRVRSVHDLDAVTRVAVTETGRAIGASRCFIRVVDEGGVLQVRRGVVHRGAGSDRRPGRAASRLQPRRPRAAHRRIGRRARGAGAAGLLARERRDADRARQPLGARHADRRLRQDDRGPGNPPA